LKRSSGSRPLVALVTPRTLLRVLRVMWLVPIVSMFGLLSIMWRFRVMTNRQIRLLAQLESTVRNVRKALEDADSADCIDWAITIQLVTADLMATVVGDIQNRSNYA
jgi:hypothetical protein